MPESIESKNSSKRLKLDQISEQFGIRVNSLRYHIKKLKSLFLDVSRDRYNRFLFTPVQVERLLRAHHLKNQGYPYEKIREQLIEASEQIQNSCNSELSTQVKINPVSIDDDRRGLSHKLEQLENHHRKLHEINKILMKANKRLDLIITEQSTKIDSLEERVALLIDLHTENLLKRGFSVDSNRENICLDDEEQTD